jgi:hypothetical protein
MTRDVVHAPRSTARGNVAAMPAKAGVAGSGGDLSRFAVKGCA